ncbi:MAG TPA: tyrosine-type recombinase/integrase [Reyranellaceae bacterium]|nr:tyrosine-type recombinase/integrase [Reyranellaceae bacterium]
MVKGERKPVSLETSDLAVAIAKRDAMLAAKNTEEVERVLGRARNIASLAEIDTAYRAADWPRQKTRENNLRALWLIVRRGTGGTKVDLERSSSVLTGQLVDRYQDDVVRQARAEAAAKKLSKEETESLVDRAKYSANRMLAQARSVFANEKPFRGMRLPPDLEEFRGRDEFKVTRDLAFKPMTRAEMDLFAAESRELRVPALDDKDEVKRGIYLTWLCMRWLGMRNEEVEFCKPAEWIVEKTVVDRTTGVAKPIHVMRITNREYFKVKGVGSIRDLPIAPWLLAELRVFSQGREWLISDANATARANITHRDINIWIAGVQRDAIATRELPAGTAERTAYDFRKQAGSELLEQGASIVEVSKWLGHRDVNTTTKWYVNLLRELPILGGLSVA